jgi:hypothetical protein
MFSLSAYSIGGSFARTPLVQSICGSGNNSSVILGCARSVKNFQSLHDVFFSGENSFLSVSDYDARRRRLDVVFADEGGESNKYWPWVCGHEFNPVLLEEFFEVFLLLYLVFGSVKKDRSRPKHIRQATVGADDLQKILGVELGGPVNRCIDKSQTYYVSLHEIREEAFYLWLHTTAWTAEIVRVETHLNFALPEGGRFDALSPS